MTNDQIRIIRSIDEFTSAVNYLDEIIASERVMRRNEYLAANRKPPHRIKYEELDLSKYKNQCLSIHKTLQVRVLKRFLKKIHEKKARRISIAGVCELIKDEYVGRFWDLYERKIGLYADSTVYDYIWEEGFKSEGIELVHSAFRREFVQSLVLESGVPKKRAGEIIKFFILFWKYLRRYEEIDELINEINSRKFNLDFIPTADREELVNLSKGAAEFSRAYSLAVYKLSKVVEFIEQSEDILAGNISDYIDLIHRGCGIHPLEILRDSDQLKRLYDKILGFITPEKLIRIMKSCLPGDMIRIPSGEIVRIDKYKSIMYGDHILNDTKFTCVPVLGYTSQSLEKLSFQNVIRNDQDILYKSYSKISPVVNGRERSDLVHQFYSPKYSKPTFQGYIFHVHMQPAMSVNISSGQFSETVRELEGVFCYPSLQYFGSTRKGHPHIVCYIPSFRIKSSELSNRKLLFYSDIGSEPFANLKLDPDGLGVFSDKTVNIEHPMEGHLKLWAVRADNMDVISVSSKPVMFDIYLDDAMLFSPYTHRMLNSRLKGEAARFGSKSFVLMVSKKLKEEEISFTGLEQGDIDEHGDYRLIHLSWSNRESPCFISAGNKNWGFETCLDYNIYLNKKAKTSLFFNDKQGTSPNDFELVISPVPSDKIKDDLLWNIISNNGQPYRIQYKKGPQGIQDGKTVRLRGNDLADLLEPVWSSQYPFNSVVELSLCTRDTEIGNAKFWLLPEFNVTSSLHFADNEDVRLSVQIDKQHQYDVTLYDKLGSSKAKLRFEYKEDTWNVVEREYRGLLELDLYGTSIEFSVLPTISGFRFGNRNKEKSEVVRNVLFNEINMLDLLIVRESNLPPAININSKFIKLNFEKSGTLFVVRLEDLKYALLQSDNIIDIVSDKKITFNVKYNLNIKSVSLQDHIINNSVMGLISFSGPKGQSIKFLVHSEEKEEIAIFDLICDGKEYSDYPFSIDLERLPSEYCQVSMFLIYDSNESIHEHGKKWKIHTNTSAVVNQDYDFLKTSSLSSFRNKKYFDAKRILVLAENIAPEHEFEWITNFRSEIDFCIKYYQIYSILNQARIVIGKEYFIY